MERRNHPRRDVSRALRIDTETRRDLMGVSRNVSALGLQFHGADAFTVGERLAVRLFDEGCERVESVAIGSVVRAERDEQGPAVVFPHVTAIHLESPLPKRLVPRGAW